MREEGPQRLRWDVGQLEALSAVAATGSFEAAAARLHVTPSGVSQRLRALEAATGRVLLVRSRPARPTPSGEAVLRLARQVEAAAAQTAAELGAGDGGLPEVAVAVGADALTTWVLPALAPLAAEVRLDLRREDESRTTALLRSGEVMAAVTSDTARVPGCSTTRLGRMRYRPVASPAVARRWFPDGLSAAALTAAPVVVYDRGDRLQHDFAARRARRPVDPPSHHVPGSTAFLAAVRAGMGWGMLPDLQSAPGLADGSLVALAPGDAPRDRSDVVLHWQQWSLRSAALDAVADAVRTAARAVLR
ncbi:LysR family transcriptional regulator ArgP [Pseudokineococcus marinus]|uniref:LysR family transcriptional regulator ArgP n=1 Tax=Pseudokineococcus marinus TaxID=351215 RepID=UPI001FE6518A|nr:LysR family transcriptional regulator ArgP [Pseudokineococcus marinus]